MISHGLPTISPRSPLLFLILPLISPSSSPLISARAQVALEEMRELASQGQQLSVLMPEQVWLDKMTADAEAWLASADALSTPEATLDELAKCVSHPLRSPPLTPPLTPPLSSP